MRVRPAARRERHSDVRERDVVIALVQCGAREHGWLIGDQRAVLGRARQRSERVLRELHQRGVVHGARARDDDAGARVVRRDVVMNVAARDGLDVVLGAQDGAAQAAILVRGGVQ